MAPRNRSVRSLSAAALAALLLAAAPAGAWDARGHRVVAAIAWEEMDPAVRAEAVRLLLAAPPDSDLPGLMPAAGPEEERRRELFLAAGTWPDLVRDQDRPARREAYHRSNWHYINLFWDHGGPAGAPRERTDLSPDPTNAVERLGALTRTLADPAAPAAERGIAAAWVIHLVGDLHQPLHATARVTAAEPEGDRGGNLFSLGRRGDRELDLHWYWDGILRAAPCWWTEDRTVRRLRAAYPPPPGPAPAGVEGFDFMAWAREALATTQAVVYPPDLARGEEPPRRYRDAAYETSKAAIARAGHRLAAVLEAALGDTRHEP